MMSLPAIENMIIYEDSSILVINKPAHLPVLPDGWETDAPYLLKLLQTKYPDVLVVHRLDKVTSGVMVFALNGDAHRILNKQFELHSNKKIYHTICSGIPGWEQHTARHKLRVNVGHSHRTVVDNGKGKPCETHFRVLQRFSGAGCALLEATPATGRTHQIRVHAYALGYPLLGDALYSAPPTALINRPALHAQSLSITHPAENLQMTFTAPYPEDFEQVLKNIS